MAGEVTAYVSGHRLKQEEVQIRPIAGHQPLAALAGRLVSVLQW